MSAPMQPNPCSGGRCCPPPAAPDASGLARHTPLLRALADPTRLGIVEMLLRAGGTLCVCDLESGFELSQPTISHHLRLLREAGVVRTERRGTWMHYALAPALIPALQAFANELSQLWAHDPQRSMS